MSYTYYGQLPNLLPMRRSILHVVDKRVEKNVREKIKNYITPKEVVLIMDDRTNTLSKSSVMEYDTIMIHDTLDLAWLRNKLLTTKMVPLVKQFLDHKEVIFVGKSIGLSAEYLTVLPDDNHGLSIDLLGFDVTGDRVIGGINYHELSVENKRQALEISKRDALWFFGPGTGYVNKKMVGSDLNKEVTFLAHGMVNSVKVRHLLPE